MTTTHSSSGREQRLASTLTTLWRQTGFAPVLFVLLLAVNVLINPERFAPAAWGTLIGLAAPLVGAALASTPPVLGGRGGIDISVGPLMGFVNAIVVLVLIQNMGIQSPWIIVPAAIIVGALVGAVNGLLATVLRIQPIVATLGTYLILIGATLTILPAPTGTVPDWLRALGGPLSILPLGAICLVWIVIRRLPYYDFLMATGSDDRAAYTSGVPVTLVRFLTYVLAGRHRDCAEREVRAHDIRRLTIHRRVPGRKVVVVDDEQPWRARLHLQYHLVEAAVHDGHAPLHCARLRRSRECFGEQCGLRWIERRIQHTFECDVVGDDLRLSDQERTRQYALEAVHRTARTDEHLLEHRMLDTSWRNQVFRVRPLQQTEVFHTTAVGRLHDAYGVRHLVLLADQPVVVAHLVAMMAADLFDPVHRQDVAGIGWLTECVAEIVHTEDFTRGLALLQEPDRLVRLQHRGIHGEAVEQHGRAHEWSAHAVLVERRCSDQQPEREHGSVQAA